MSLRPKASCLTNGPLGSAAPAGGARPGLRQTQAQGDIQFYQSRASCRREPGSRRGARPRLRSGGVPGDLLPHFPGSSLGRGRHSQEREAPASAKNVSGSGSRRSWISVGLGVGIWKVCGLGHRGEESVLGCSWPRGIQGYGYCPSGEQDSGIPQLELLIKVGTQSETCFASV